MKIEAIEIIIELENNKKYGFKKCLDINSSKSNTFIIHGSNELGKTTLFKSIIYALAGEELYGKGNILPDIFIRIDSSNSTVSKILLQLNNDDESIVIERNALDPLDPIKVYRNCTVNSYKTTNIIEHYKSKKERDIDGNRLYQDFLFEYFKIPHLKDSESGHQIYFQNLMPLFVIPQISWGDIQENNPFYGLHNVRQKAFEIILGFKDSYTEFSDKSKMKQKELLLKEKERQLEKIEEIVQLFSVDTIQNNSSLKLEYENTISEIEQYLNTIESGAKPNTKSIEPYKNKYRKLILIEKRYTEQIELLEKEINEYKHYLNNLEAEIFKLDKLKTAKKLISIIPVKDCPHCFNEININEDEEINDNFCSLCGNTMKSLETANNSDIHNYLKDEIKDFKRIMNLKKDQLQLLINKKYLIQLDLKEIQSIIDSSLSEPMPEIIKQYKSYSSELGRLRNEISRLEREEKVLADKLTIEHECDMLIEDIKALKKKKTSDDTDLDKEKLQYLEIKFKEILKRIDFIKDGFDGQKLTDASDKIFADIYIDRDNYMPKIKGRNFFNITSSSGLIRIIVAYYLSILYTCDKFEMTCNHPKILLLDEPRQHNLDITTFNTITQCFLELTHNSAFQVIFTSGDLGTLSPENILVDLDLHGMLIQEI